ncbi:Type 1 glutamine amidotransferase-like domain-containing protein [Candidatus Absconditicoccus praedator]|uniref:Type 1 glutamine amidotransferase-like domain-containing protein n=1 Tax=Candidatus Absconditicoccus praedator TaxID=2735562 RepID=UPI001E57212F|nr:Type 1 glutamine amidotransferase-like domain-containing protein [Candidatus Absconditicoccus praedator]UFX82598.1 Type 1 glutamine amidotransferase-like domain-containing protein [Candidatus Absconditicoccus praedator]
MNNIFLSGGGDAQQSEKFDRLYKNALPGNKILYIPWAFYPQSYDGCRKWIDTIFPAERGYKLEILHEDDNFDTDSLVNDYDGVYIGGGNTFRLWNLIKQTGFDKLLKKFTELGKPVYGGSAGAIIMGKEINTSPDLNVTKLTDQDCLGLNYFDGYSIFCHYKAKQDPEIYDYIRNYGFPVIALEEGVGVYLQDGRIYSGGEGSAYVITLDGKKEI